MRLRKMFEDLSIIAAVTILVVSYYFRGPTPGADVTMHLSRVRIIMDNFSIMPRWNPYWYFGIPFLRVYSGLFHYSLAGLGLVLSVLFAELPINEIISLAITIYTYLIFMIGAISIYFLARELELSRFGAISSAILFVTSYNIYGFWGVGSYPNISSLLISPLPLALYIRGVKKRRLSYALPVGFAYGLVVLLYVSNAVYLLVFFIIFSVFMLIRKSDLLYIPKMDNQAPKYTLILPKIAGLSAISAIASVAWWLFPFYTSITTSSSSFSESLSLVTPVTIQIYLTEYFLSISGFNGFSLSTPGVGHFALMLLSIFLVIRLWRAPSADGVFAAMISFLLCFTPWLGFKIPFLPVGRLPLFFSLFASLAGGFALSALLQSYKRIITKSSVIGTGFLKVILPTLMGSFVLTSASLPLFFSIGPFPSVQLPSWNKVLQQKVKLGERIGIDGGYSLNLVSNVWQSGGGSIESMYILNEFAYTFWYYLLYEKDARYLPYFSRNYNVKYMIGTSMEGLKKTEGQGLYEVSSFRSSIAEIIPRDSLLVLHVGSKAQYTYLFISTALAGDVEPILVDGGRYLEDFSVEDLKHFDLLYISEIKTRNDKTYAALIRSYLENGGGVLFDINKIPLMLSNEIAKLLPIRGMIKKTSNLNLLFSPVFSDVASTPFKEVRETQILYARELKERAEVIAWEEDGNPVIVRMKEYNGWVAWSGINLPYQVMLREDYEGACLLVRLMRFLTYYKVNSSSNRSVRYGDFVAVSTDYYIVNLTNLSIDDGVWFKMTYYPGWEAIVKDNGEKLKIFLAGPHGMLVFPHRDTSSSIVFRFNRTNEVILGELMSTAFFIVFFVIFIVYPIITRFWRIPEGWTHTHHKGAYVHLIKKKSLTAKREELKKDSQKPSTNDCSV